MHSQNCETGLLTSSDTHFCPSVQSSVCPDGKTRLHGRNFNDFLFDYFGKAIRKIQVSLKYDKMTDTIHEDLYLYLW